MGDVYGVLCLFCDGKWFCLYIISFLKDLTGVKYHAGFAVE